MRCFQEKYKLVKTEGTVTEKDLIIQDLPIKIEGDTIIGRFEHIRRLEAKTNKRIPAKHLNEIELLPEDDDVIILETGSTNVDFATEE